MTATTNALAFAKTGNEYAAPAGELTYYVRRRGSEWEASLKRTTGGPWINARTTFGTMREAKDWCAWDYETN